MSLSSNSDKKETIDEIERRLNSLQSKLLLTDTITTVVNMQCMFVENTTDINFQKRSLNTNFVRSDVYFNFRKEV
jgi:AAA15 family ATPase/GTPase